MHCEQEGVENMLTYKRLEIVYKFCVYTIASPNKCPLILSMVEKNLTSLHILMFHSICLLQFSSLVLFMCYLYNLFTTLLIDQLKLIVKNIIFYTYVTFKKKL